MTESIQKIMLFLSKNKTVTLPMLQNYLNLSYDATNSVVNELKVRGKIYFDEDTMIVSAVTTCKEISDIERNLLKNVTELEEIDYELMLAIRYYPNGIDASDIKKLIKLDYTTSELQKSALRLSKLNAIYYVYDKIYTNISRFTLNTLYIRMLKLGKILDANTFTDNYTLFYVESNQEYSTQLELFRKHFNRQKLADDKVLLAKIVKEEKQDEKNAVKKSFRPTSQSVMSYYELIKQEQDEFYKNYWINNVITEKMVVTQFPIKGVLQNDELRTLYSLLANYKLTRPFEGAIAVAIDNSFIKDLTLYIEYYDEKVYIFDDKMTLNYMFSNYDASSSMSNYLNEVVLNFPSINIYRGMICGVCEMNARKVVQMLNDIQLLIGHILSYRIIFKMYAKNDDSIDILGNIVDDDLFIPDYVSPIGDDFF